MRDRVIEWLKKNVDEHRLQHILGVEETCINLARCHHLDENKAATAGLMHDLAKFFPPPKLLAIATKAKIPLDEVCLNYPHLLHAEVGAVVAKEEFGVKDPEIIAAIANHTLGAPQMSRLSCVVFVADVIEPNRGDNTELTLLREIAAQNLYKCVQQTADYSLKYLLSKQKIIHPRTVLTRNWALALAKSDRSLLTIEAYDKSA